MVESTALEMRRTFTGTVGSNPTLSANIRRPVPEDLQAYFLTASGEPHSPVQRLG